MDLKSSRKLWLVTGGAGYIGSHIVRALLENNIRVKVIDSLISGTSAAIPDDVELINVDINDYKSVEKVFNLNQFDGVINAAGLKSVLQSFNEPESYYQTNVEAVKNLLHLKDKKTYFLQSSSAAIYGNPTLLPVTEDLLPNPISVYGKTKLLAEFEVLKDSNGVNLRYFNVLGSGMPLLKDKNSESIINKVINRINGGLEPQIYGNSHDTIDGTCIRDYIDVRDVAIAHILAINALNEGKILRSINIGTGIGYSVIQVLDEIHKIIGKPLSYSVEPKRDGEISKIIASIDRAKNLLLFKPSYSLKEMISTSV